MEKQVQSQEVKAQEVKAQEVKKAPEAPKANSSKKKEEAKKVSVADQLKASLEKIHQEKSGESEKPFDEILKLVQDSKSTDFELLMLTYESRKVYYLYLVDEKAGKSIFLTKNDSIMKNKVIATKLVQSLKKDRIKITYHKKGREKDAVENIGKNTYADKIEKYSEKKAQ